jgi:YhcH/YjgK/YiaL family protein
MILDRLENYPDSEIRNPRILAGFRYLRSFDPATPVGRVPILGGDVYALVQAFTTKPPSERRFEAHRDFLDIQWVHQGAERLFVEQVGRREAATEYDAANDITFYKDNPVTTAIVLKAGDFAVFHPWDAHKTSCDAGDPGTVRKVVIKVRLK